MDITQLILDDHQEQRRLFAILEQIDRGRTEALGAAALLGLGLCQLPDYVVQDELARGKLVEVIAAHRPPPMPLSAVVPSGRLMPPRVRVLLDALETLHDRDR